MLAAAVALALAAPLAVPFVPQGKDTCGAAALAMVLRYWGQEAGHDEIAGALLEPELRGIAGSKLEAFARGRGMTAIAHAGDLDHLRGHIGKGRPLIVAWAMGGGRYHDVVVTGVDDDKREVVVHDPARGASRRVGFEPFERRWAKAGRWTLLVVPAR